MTLPEIKHIGILLFNDVEELPWEVLSYWTRNHPEDGFAVSCLSKSGGLVQCPKGLAVHRAPDITMSRALAPRAPPLRGQNSL
ncbi:MAG TPA: hypothetical protein VIJ07_08135 [Dermatophilaceae bacterium]